MAGAIFGRQAPAVLGLGESHLQGSRTTGWPRMAARSGSARAARSDPLVGPAAPATECSDPRVRSLAGPDAPFVPDPCQKYWHEAAN